jgi:hypothetical protein
MMSIVNVIQFTFFTWLITQQKIDVTFRWSEINTQTEKQALQ